MKVLSRRRPTPAEKKAGERAMSEEIRRQIAEWDKEYEVNLNALVLYVLRVHLGFGPVRLRRFWDAFREEHKALREYYAMGDDPDVGEWLAKRKLREIGVDVEQWTKEDDDGT